MFAQFGAIFAAVGSAVKIFAIRFRTLAGLLAAAVALAGCMPATVPLAGPDPADPGAKVSGVGYRSTISPYTSLRPVGPSSWREQNERVTPAPKSNR